MSTRPYLAALYQKNISCSESVPVSSKYFSAHDIDEVTLSPLVIVSSLALVGYAILNLEQTNAMNAKCPTPRKERESLRSSSG